MLLKIIELLLNLNKTNNKINSKNIMWWKYIEILKC